MPKTKVNTPFKAPRTAKDKATKSDRNVDKVSNATVKGHRKDNSEWGKRMERELELIERKQQTLLSAKQSTDSDSDGVDVPIVQTLQTQVDIEDKVTEDIADDAPIVQALQTQFIKTMSEREADEKAKFGEVQR